MAAGRSAGPALAAVAIVAVVVGPSLADATASWDRPTGLVVAIAALACGFGATGGAVAAVPLGGVGSAGALVATAGAVVLAVPDTEGPVLAAAALGTCWLGLVLTRSLTAAPLAEGMAALVGAAVVLVGLGGATDGVAAAIGAAGCVAVLLGAAPLSRLRGRAPAVPASAAVVIVGAGAAVVARLGAVRATSARALLVTVVATAGVTVALEAVARLTSEREPPSP